MNLTVFYGGRSDTSSGDSDDTDFFVSSDDPDDELSKESDESETDEEQDGEHYFLLCYEQNFNLSGIFFFYVICGVVFPSTVE